MKLPFLRSSYTSPGVLILLLMAGVLALGAAAAHADDGKIYPGSHCVRWSGPTPVYNFSLLGNPSTETLLRVDCPVVHDTINGDIRDGIVRVIDQSHDEVRCSLISVFVNGGGGLSYWTSGVKETEGTSGLVKRLDFGSLPGDSTSHYFYSCDIPTVHEGAMSWLISYRVDED